MAEQSETGKTPLVKIPGKHGSASAYGYFASLTIWLAYCILLLVPWIVGRSLAHLNTGRVAG